jgi:hypothetical protein
MGAIRYVTAPDALKLLQRSDRFEMGESEGRVAVIREKQPPGWVAPEPDLTPDFMCEDVFRRRAEAQLDLQRHQDLGPSAYTGGDCTCGHGDDWCEHCRNHCLVCGLARSLHPIQRTGDDNFLGVEHHFVGVTDEVDDVEGLFGPEEEEIDLT